MPFAVVQGVPSSGSAGSRGRRSALTTSGAGTPEPDVGGSSPRAFQISGPTTPLAVRLFFFWNSKTADSVPGPKSPSTESPGEGVIFAFKSFWSFSTRSPVDPIRKADSSGRPRP